MSMRQSFAYDNCVTRCFGLGGGGRSPGRTNVVVCRDILSEGVRELYMDSCGSK